MKYDIDLFQVPNSYSKGVSKGPGFWIFGGQGVIWKLDEKADTDFYIDVTS